MSTAAPAREASAKAIVAMAKDLSGGTNKRAAHLVNLALATLKWLMLNAESDDIRYSAAQALLGLAPMQQKLDYMREVVQKPGPRKGTANRPEVAAKRLKTIMGQSPEAAQRVLAALAEAENEAKATPNPQQKAA